MDPHGDARRPQIADELELSGRWPLGGDLEHECAFVEQLSIGGGTVGRIVGRIVGVIRLFVRRFVMLRTHLWIIDAAIDGEAGKQSDSR